MYSKLSIKEIKKSVENLRKEEYILAINHLRMDNREGVKKISMDLCRKLESMQKEEARVQALISFDKAFGRTIIAGVDEVGRGPLAGPVVAACVVMKEDSNILYVNDSKKLSEAKRKDLYQRIIDDSIAYGIGVADNLEIDENNILNATFLAMKRAIENAGIKVDMLLVDGNQKIKDIDLEQVTVIQGDGSSYCIACASILAKVYRDNLMEEYHSVYPNYDFASNKGYGTNNHYIGIRQNGITPIHRRSFLKEML